MQRSVDEVMASIDLERLVVLRLGEVGKIVSGLSILSQHGIEPKLRCEVCGGTVVVNGLKSEKFIECPSCGMEWYRG